jgi:hypothetical protein
MPTVTVSPKVVGTLSLSSGAHSRDPLALPTLRFCVVSQSSSNTGGSNQFVSDRPPSTTIAAPVT